MQHNDYDSSWERERFLEELYFLEMERDWLEFGESLNLMERDSKESLTVSNRIIAQIPLNNINFYPKQGA